MASLPPVRKVRLTGPAGALDGRLELVDPPRALAVFGHPHPQHGGTMQNNVVVHASRELVDHGCAVLRFNFRGVGESAGEYDQGVGETEDYRAAVRWLRAEFRSVGFLVAAGFSFGSIRAWRVAAAREADAYLGIAPPITRPENVGLPRVEVPSALVLAERDELVPAPSASQLAQSFADLRHQRTVAGAGHLFGGKLDALRAAVAASVPFLMEQ